MGDFVAPVKILLRQLETGIKLSTRISEAATSATASKALDIRESASSLQRCLERNAQGIRDAYHQCVEACNEPFTQALVEDKALTNRLKELKNEVRDRIDECQDFEDEPDSFDPIAFANIQKESQKCYAECISIFDRVRGQILEARPTSSQSQPKDDRAFLTSVRTQEQIPSRKPLPFASQPPANTPTVRQHIHRSSFKPLPQEPVKPRNPWAINGPSQFDLGPPSPSSRRQSFRDIPPSSLPPPHAEELQRYIPKEVVRYRISVNDDFLERRRQSKIMFQNELKRQSLPRPSSSASEERPNTEERRISGTIEENRVSEVFLNGPLISSTQSGSSVLPSSPLESRLSRSGSNGYDTMVSRQRSIGQNSQDARHSRTSSVFQEGSAQRPELQRHDSTTSQESIFGNRAAMRSPTIALNPIAPPLSPPLSDHRGSNGLAIEHLATSLRTPAFGQGVYEGMEVVDQNIIDYSSEKMVVVARDLPANHPARISAPTTTASVKSIDCPMPINNSFFMSKGFCPGAEAYMRGQSWYKIVKKPSGHYSATVSAKCNNCSFEVGWNDIEKERMLDLSGIYMSSGVRWRQRFISKSHIRTNHVESANYACVFCVEENKTVEPHDATVFFSIHQLFRHLAKHPQPLPQVQGITVLYGVQPLSVLDFDVHMTTSILKLPEFNIMEIRQKVATRPSAQAIVTHHPKAGSNGARDPDRNPVLNFVVGAKIVGITFPDRFKGEWCQGYHDGEKGCFPSSTIQLGMPIAEDMVRTPRSTLVTTAKWDFKPHKEAKDGGWLKLKRGDRITSVSYTFIDQWCWSGQNSNGKWGIFPKAFVEAPEDGTRLGLATSPGMMKQSSFGAKISSFSLGRKSSRQERTDRATSIKSTGSGGSMVIINESQPGLEVGSPSSLPTQHLQTYGSWRT